MGTIKLVGIIFLFFNSICYPQTEPLSVSINSAKNKAHNQDLSTSSLGQEQPAPTNPIPAKEVNDASTPLEQSRAALADTLNLIESENAELLEILKSKEDNLDHLKTQLSEIPKEGVATTRTQIEINYSKTSLIWMKSVDYLLELFSSINLQSNIEIPAQLTQENETESLNYNAYIEQHVHVTEQQNELLNLRAQALTHLKIQNFKLLRDAGSLRAALLEKCDVLNCNRPRGLNEQNLNLFVRELKVVPLKFLAGGLTKWLEIRSKISSGINGWLDLSKQFLIFLLVLAIPFSLVRALRWTTLKLDDLKKGLLSKSMLDYRRRTQFAIWISRINPFVPSVGMIISIAIARNLVVSTDLSELGTFFYYFQIFYVFKTFKLILMVGLEIVFTTASVDTLKQQKSRIEKSATAVTRLIFIEFLILHITEDTVRKALAYQLFSTFIFYINIAFALIETSRWRDEILESFSLRFPKLWVRFKFISSSKVEKLILPILFSVVVLNDLIRFTSSYLIRLDLVKRLLSEVLRKRLERAEKDLKTFNSPSDDYLKVFDYYLPARNDILVEQEESVVEQVVTAVSNWSNRKSTDDLFIISGNRGMGKSTALHYIHEKVQNEVVAKLIRVQPKLVDQAKFFNWLSETLGSPIKTIEDIRSFDSALDKKLVICVDDIQNLFLGVIGGLDSYRLFVDIISLRTSNLYWVLSVNSRSWAYLKGIMGAEHFYGQVVTLKPWKDFEIQNLILKRHRKTKYDRSFDNSIKAYGAGDSLGEQAEAQFFRLLWGQSRGNPRSALMYWVSAISSPFPEQIHVGIPAFVSSNLVATMSDDSLFLLSAIAKHDSLTHDELREITGIEHTVIRKCLKEAQDKQLIWADTTGRVRISSKAQYVIDYFLIGKNFLYE